MDKDSPLIDGEKQSASVKERAFNLTPSSFFIFAISFSPSHIERGCRVLLLKKCSQG